MGKQNRIAFRVRDLLFILAVVALISSVIIPNLTAPDSAEGDLTGCQSNLYNIATSLEMYRTDWSGNYPKELSGLVPNYIRTIPICPAAEIDTYSSSYSVESFESEEPSTEFIYRMNCQGRHHGALNSPKYSATKGPHS